jgi:copper homeostasis protein
MKFHNESIMMSAEAGDEYSIDVTGVDRVKELIRLANS